MDALQDQLMDYAAAKRDEIIDNCNNGITDTDLGPTDKPNRLAVSPGCLLKFGDSVLCNGTTVLYLCPGRGEGFLYGLTLEESQITLGTYDVNGITDRAPLDPEEEPMPIFAEV